MSGYSRRSGDGDPLWIIDVCYHWGMNNPLAAEARIDEKMFTMELIPFPKPPPAEPLPLEKWLRRVDRAESGRDAFFRGRDEEYEMFRSAVMSLDDGVVGGGTMIFQGAPGAGKSALMAECVESVRHHSTPENPWVAVIVKPGSLRFPDRVVRGMVHAVNLEGERLRQASSGSISSMLGKVLDRGLEMLREIPERDVSVGGVSWSGRDRDVSAEGLFEHAAPVLGRFHIVVCVDEAQNTPVSDMTRDVIDCLHDPPGNLPLVTAFFGLSNTQDVLRQCGLSRFADERVVDIDPLPMKDAASAIQGVFDAYGFMGMAEDRKAWVRNLAELSQGWPQHINRVAVAAARVIGDNDGWIGADHLEKALERGRERKDAYYAGRLAAGSRPPRIYRKMALVAGENGGVLSCDDIESLIEEMLGKTGETLDNFLTDALHAGLLAPMKELPYHYRIPVPSFGDYLRALPVEPIRN